MDSGWVVALELALVFGGVLAFGARELLELRRYDRRKAEPAGREGSERG